VVTVAVNEKATWGNGRKWDSEDIKVFFDHVKDPSYSWASVEGVDKVEKVEIVDKQTAKVTFNSIYPDWSNALAGITPRELMADAKTFNERLDFDGVVLTKLDGDTRGGAALSIRTVVDKPIKFVGMGEKMDALDVFHPDRMADRILGMGDIVSLVERAQQLYDEREAKRLEERIAKDQFDFNDFLAQIQQIKKMGNIKDLAAMIPGVGKALKDIDIKDDAFKSIEAIIYSMTPEERAKPHILDGHRRKRIALGSGTSVQDVNKLLTQFTQTRKMMKTLQGFKGGKMPKMPKMPFMGGGKLR